MNMNMEMLPFKAAGSYFSISKDSMQRGSGIWLRSLIRPEWGTGRNKISDHMFRITPVNRQLEFVPYEIDFQVHRLLFSMLGGEVEIFFSDTTEITFILKNAGLVIEHDHDDNKAVNIALRGATFSCFFPVSQFETTFSSEDSEMTYASMTRRLFLSPTKNEGQIQFKGWKKGLERPQGKYRARTSMQVLDAFNSFAKPFNADTDIFFRALYVLWSGEYAKCGNFPYRVTAISINNMNLVWSWDNCFIAFALAKTDPEIAWNNMLLFLDKLEPDGRMLDAINPGLAVSWFVKPPVQGLFIQKMLDEGYGLADERLLSLYVQLSKWTNWWKNYQHESGLYYYNHPFDSGWDNATCFDSGVKMVTPDINAYLAVQMEVLSRLAVKLGRVEEGTSWLKQSDVLIVKMVDVLYQNGRFSVMDLNNTIFKTDSLIRMMPIILGERLDKKITESLFLELGEENHFLTPCGLATESARSKLYDTRKGDSAKPNPYWRGPVWAPVLYLIYDAIKEKSDGILADKIAVRFTETVEKNGGFFYENYDAITGVGYDDTGYGWTAAVYLLLKTI